MNPLKNLLEFHEKEMDKTAEIMTRSPWENEKFYTEWCAQFFYFVAHATRLLAASAARLDLKRDALHIRFLDHCQEEKHHEKLFEQDLKFFGKTPQDFEEHPLAASMYQSQYYLIDYADPMALFGSILFLEGMSISAGPDIYERIKAKHTDKGCNFIKVHVHDDQDHIIKAKKALESLSEKELVAITTSYKQSAYAFNTLLEELNAKHLKVSNSKAA